MQRILLCWVVFRLVAMEIISSLGSKSPSLAIFTWEVTGDFFNFCSLHLPLRLEGKAWGSSLSPSRDWSQMSTIFSTTTPHSSREFGGPSNSKSLRWATSRSGFVGANSIKLFGRTNLSLKIVGPWISNVNITGEWVANHVVSITQILLTNGINSLEMMAESGRVDSMQVLGMGLPCWEWYMVAKSREPFCRNSSQTGKFVISALKSPATMCGKGISDICSKTSSSSSLVRSRCLGCDAAYP